MSNDNHIHVKQTKRRKLDRDEGDAEYQFNKRIRTEYIKHEVVNDLFSDLPPEIRHYVLSFITDDSQRRHIRLVCQLWFHDINYNEFRIGLLLASEVKQFSRCFGRYRTPIGIKFMKLDYLRNTKTAVSHQLMTSGHFSRAIRNLTQLTALDLSIKNLELPVELVNLQSLTVTCPLYGYHIARLTNLTRLETTAPFAMTPTTLVSLSFHRNDNFNVEFDDECSKLTELKITTETASLPELPSSLRKLHIRSIANVTTTQNLANLEELVSNIAVPTLFQSNLTKLDIWSTSTAVEYNEHLKQLKHISCYDINLHTTYSLQLESCHLFRPDSNILRHLDTNKITQLKVGVCRNSPSDVLSKFSKLVELDLKVDLAHDVPWEIHLPHLTKLNMTYSNEQMFTNTDGLTNLIELNLTQRTERTKNPQTIDFQCMQHLTSIILSGCFRDINLFNLTSLRKLEIENLTSYITILVHGLSTLTNLTSLIIPHIRHCYLSNYEDITHLTKLQELRAKQDLGKPVDLGTLTHLQYLTYLDVQATNESASLLTKLSRLQRIDIQTSAQLVNERGILNALPFCHSLRNDWRR